MKCFKRPDKPMASTITTFVFYILLCLEFYPAKAQTLIRVGYWDPIDEFHISSINSSLFTHLICFSTQVDSTSYEQYVSPTDEEQFSKFTEIVRQKNPSVTTLLSVGGRDTNYSTFSSMTSKSSSRKSFIDSSIRLARLYGFQGLDLYRVEPELGDDSVNLGKLFDEWRAAIDLEARNSNHAQLILTARFGFTPEVSVGNYPVESIQRCLDWVHMVTAEYGTPDSTNSTSASAALYDPRSNSNTDYGIRMWIDAGLSADKLVLCLPFYGYAWTLVDAEINGIGAPAEGPAISIDGFVTYYEIKNYINQSVHVMYSSTYAVNYFSVGKIWFGFDDVEAIRRKVSYAKEKRLLGYYAWRVSYDDDNWVLSQAAANQSKIISSPDIPSAPLNNTNSSNTSLAPVNKNNNSKRHLLVIILSSTATASILLLGFFIYCFMMRKAIIKGNSKSKDEEDLNTNVPDLKEYSLVEIEAATNRFSIGNKLGEGGYGPVYRGVLEDGQEIAVKKLSKTSSQGFSEFRNEVRLTAKLQHVNLVRVLGFCIDREDHMLIYEYMPNRSLDYYIFDPLRRLILDWGKRVHIIEGITQGLLYLQEYSRLTIIHRDLKASNVLLDEDMKPKISDFGMARIFVKGNLEASTEQFAGTQGIIPPEYIKTGVYSTKFDVYSFGILLLQIISGKRVSILHGLNKNLSLPAHAYEMWKVGKGMEFVDPSLDDTHFSCKLMGCLQIALLCVQENANDRPSMLDISLMLKNDTAEINTPKKPDLISIEDVEPKICSANDVTNSDVAPR